jgi:SAM-dependent methyltransferase
LIDRHIGITAARRLRRIVRPAWFGTLRRTEPISRAWGFDRGRPIDRYYIEAFLAAHSAFITGEVIEVQNSDYTNRFGTAVTRAHILDIDAANPNATLIADLADAHNIPAESFDCFVLTQTLHIIFDIQQAIRHCHRMLKPGGSLLCTVPSVSRIHKTRGVDHDYWRLTKASCTRLFGDVFGAEQVEVSVYGNVLAAVAFLEGVAAEELPSRKLDLHDPDFPTLIGVRAWKRA